MIMAFGYTCSLVAANSAFCVVVQNCAAPQFSSLPLLFPQKPRFCGSGMVNLVYFIECVRLSRRPRAKRDGGGMAVAAPPAEGRCLLKLKAHTTAILRFGGAALK